MDPKNPATPGNKAALARSSQGIRVFTYPKVIFIFPTLIVSLICWLGMMMIGDRLDDPIKKAETQSKAQLSPEELKVAEAPTPAVAEHRRFETTQNLLGVLFLVVLAFNLLIMAIDFPRFSIVAVLLLGLFLIFFFLWVGAYFDVDLLKSIRALMGGIYAVANAQFYLMTFLILAAIFAIIIGTRYLDYWEIRPNEILHHHGPLSDLERYPTVNLKFDKEIPDVIEHMFLGAGKLVLHLADERKSVVLDNVLFINSVEDALKGLMSRTEVRLTSDQEVVNDKSGK